ncbi:MAG: ABC transporter C-terminal domain-containing protein, partial [Propionibacteriaceae bacterium]|nr:ABC transporter C-terminal domain-containing protein [Propionibacteriaceae bacterium]
GGVDEYLELRRQQVSGAANHPGASRPRPEAEASELSGAERRAVQKEIGALERRLEKASGAIEAIHRRLAEHDQSDYEGLQRHTDELRALEAQVSGWEERWLELSAALE